MSGQDTIFKQVQRLITNFKKDSESRHSLAYFQTRIEKLKGLWAKCEEQHDAEYTRLKENKKELEQYCTEFERLEELTVDYLTLFQTKINGYTPGAISSVLPDSVKLERIRVPSFNGVYSDWFAFHDLFKSMVHQNTQLTNVQKFQYLRSALRGEAEQLINHLSVTEGNYDPAWTLLCERYDNHRIIAQEMMQRLFNIENCTRNDPSGLRQMLDTTNQLLAGIKTLNADSFALSTIFMLNQKLDEDSRKEWQRTISDSNKIPSLQQFLDFLKQRFSMLEALSTGKAKAKTVKANTTQINAKGSCPMCKSTHKLFECNSFKQATVQARRNVVKSANLCFNCFGQHRVNKCTSTHGCKVCSKKHNTLLHIPATEDTLRSKPSAPPTIQGHGVYTKQTYILLATAYIKIRRPDGEDVTFRALLDSGAQRSFISEAAVQLLQATRTSAKFRISGIGAMENVTSKGETKLHAIVKSESEQTEVIVFKPLILATITTPLPCNKIPLTIPKGLTIDDLADPNFNIPSAIDILIGADFYDQLLLPGLLPGKPCTQKTKLGWVLFGTVPCKPSTSVCAFVSYQGLEESVRKFWETEELPETRHLTNEEKANEAHFVQTVYREPSGRYSVSLPFKHNVDPFSDIGDTQKVAYIRFRQLEHRLARNPALYEQYRNFMEEYITLGHMSRVPADRIKMDTAYYLPHHAVVKESSSTTKLRVVFNASQKGSKGKSLNDLLFTGHTIQGNLLHLLMRWRQHKYVIAADIEKMYRQIFVHEKDQHFQRILWRFNQTEPIQHFQLRTVTYGTACAPYLAIRTLHQLAADESASFPQASQTLTTDFYVDDVLTGADKLDDLLKLQNELRNLLRKGGFHLRKWSSNHTRLLERIPIQERETQLPFNIAATEQIKTLGIQWHPATDEFSFKIVNPSDEKVLTKRIVLAEVAKLFDPLGWLQPCTIIGKTIIRDLWLAKKDWDEPLDCNSTKEWTRLRQQLPDLEAIRIKRWVEFSPSHQFELHGFCDSSSTAYAAASYIRVVTTTSTKVTLLAAKSKVTPINVESIPRLELNGAVLLVKLMAEVIKAHKWNNAPRFYWTDSTVVLSWIRSPAAKWKVYVANRVSIIQQHSSVEHWYHVSTHNNPADIATRGMYPKELIKCDLWWNGPAWLNARSIRMPPVMQLTGEGEQEAKTVSLVATTEEQPDILTRYSSFHKLQRIVALCQRFAFNSKHPKIKRLGSLTEAELREASNTCVRMTQSIAFKKEIQTISTNGTVLKNSHIKSLSPWIDTEGILRVGGRLQNALVEETAKHPAIIPKGPLATLLIRQAHQQTLHGGSQLTLATLRLKYWIISGLTVVKTVVRQCMTCFKMTARPMTQQMGILPAPRVRFEKPFLHTGIDYAGPITIKWNRGRGAKTTKAYIAVFVCMATKAFHLELVSDLTTSACIAAIKRFVARRGKCQVIYSDCGSNFLGANKQLQAVYRASLQACRSEAANHNIQWKFIPPSSPHFGGLWEAGVKTMKGHLYKTIGHQILNVEEMYTLLAQIEACMNSRPLTQISNDPNDIVALTPGHFLTGDHLFEVKDDPWENNPTLLKRWHLVQQMKQSFWRRWTQGYLQRLQQRSKWLQIQENPEVGELVFVKTDNIPSMRWPLARIVATHPGPDGLVRTVSLNLNGTIKKRPIVKICKLPFNKEKEQTAEVYSTPANLDSQSSKQAIKRTPDETPDTPKKKKVTTGRLPSLSALVINTLLVIGVQLPPVLSEATITSLDGGLYMEHIGKANLNRGTLRINIELPFSDLDTDERNMGSINSSIYSMCSMGKRITEKVHCWDSVHHISDTIDDTKHKINLIRFTHSRKKRGIFGQMLTAVFGVNDEIITDVQHLSTNQEVLKNLINHQGKIALQVTKRLNTTTSRINRQLKRFSDQLNKGLEEINASKKWFSMVDSNQLNIQFLGTYQRAINFITEVDLKYTHILMAINTKQGILECTKIAGLQTTIQGTQGLLPAHLTILHSSTSKVTTTSDETSIKIYGYLPIIDNRKFDLIKATAIPIQHTSTLFAAFNIPNLIMGINYHDQLYFETTSANLASASELALGTYLLSSTTLIDMKAKTNCIIRELYSLHNQPTCPQTYFRTPSLVLQKLMSTNTWLFFTPQPVHAQTVCSGLRQDILINGTGTIKLAQDCQLQAKEFILVADQTHEGRSLPIYIAPTVPEFNSTLQHADVKLLNVSKEIDTEESFTTLINEQEELATVIDGIQWKAIKPHTTLSTISISISGSILAALIIITIYLCRRTKPREINCTSQPSSFTTWYNDHRL